MEIQKIISFKDVAEINVYNKYTVYEPIAKLSKIPSPLAGEGQGEG